MGLVATMTALLLGMVTATTRIAYDAQDVALKTAAVNILTLDRHLARFGETSRPTRDLLRSAVEFRLATTWPDEGPARGFGEATSTPAIEDIQTQILAWETRTDAERYYKAEALKLSEDVMKTRWRLLATGSSIPRGFLGVVIFWLAVTFTSFGLYAPRNATVISALFICALSVALALYLIVELDGAFDGYIRISPEPLRFVLEQLGNNAIGSGDRLRNAVDTPPKSGLAFPLRPRKFGRFGLIRRILKGAHRSPGRCLA